MKEQELEEVRVYLKKGERALIRAAQGLSDTRGLSTFMRATAIAVAKAIKRRPELQNQQALQEFLNML